MKIEDRMCLNFHYIRGIAIILIVGAHCLAIMKWSGRFFPDILSILFDETSVVFMIITGFLSFRLKEKASYKEFMIHKIRNVFYPYLVTSSLAIVIYSFFLVKSPIWPHFYDGPSWFVVISFVLTGTQLAPTWYVPAVMILFALMPAVKFTSRRIGIIVFFVLIISDSVFGRNFLISLGYKFTNYAYFLEAPSRFIYLFPAFLFGYLIYKYQDGFMYIIKEKFTLLASISIVMTMMQYCYFSDHMAIFVVKLLYCLTFLSIVNRLNDGKIADILSFTATISFPIFFLHSYFVSLFRIVVGSFSVGPLYGLLLLAGMIVACILCSAVVTIVCSRLFGARARWVVGGYVPSGWNAILPASRGEGTQPLNV